MNSDPKNDLRNHLLDRLHEKSRGYVSDSGRLGNWPEKIVRKGALCRSFSKPICENRPLPPFSV